MENAVDVKTAYKKLESGAFLLDVREDDEYQAGHAQGSISIPLSELGQRLDELPKDVEIYCICKSGGRSAQAAEALRSLGYNTFNVLGGSLDWHAQELPFVADQGEAQVI